MHKEEWPNPSGHRDALSNNRRESAACLERLVLVAIPEAML